MASAEERAEIAVEVVYSPRERVVERVALRLPAGSTLQQALEASGLLQRHLGARELAVGIWGRTAAADTPLREGDRIEIYRPLRVDPKEARRLRYKAQGRRKAP